MIFRLTALLAVLAVAAGQTNQARPDSAERNSMEVSARLMQQTAGVSGINSQTSGLVTAIGRSTLGAAAQDGDAVAILTQWSFRFVIEDGIRPGQEITGVSLHCPAGPTESAPEVGNLDPVDISSDVGGVLDGSTQMIGALPDVVNFLVTSDSCYLNFTTNDYPSGELRANLQCSLATTDSGDSLPTCPSSASTLAASTAVVASILAAGVAALF